jgi:hypothetical protein
MGRHAFEPPVRRLVGRSMRAAVRATVMASRTLNILPDLIRVAQPREISLPKYWMELDLFDYRGEERTSYYRLTENGVFTQIVRSQFMYDGNFKWRIETTFSSDWTSQFFEEADVGTHFAARPVTKEGFEMAERIVLAIIAGIEPPEGV